MTHFSALISAIKDRDFRVTVNSAGIEQIHQTERNALKAELLAALCEDFAEQFEVVGRAADGVLVEIPCDTIADGISNEAGSGAITIAIDLKIKALDTDINAELESYAIDLEEKAQKAKAAAEKKARKIAADSARRNKAKAE